MRKHLQALGILLGVSAVVGLLMSMRRGDDGARLAVSSSTEPPTSATMTESMRAQMPDPSGTDAAVATRHQANQPTQPGKSVRLGLTSGQLPTPEFLRSEPRITAPPEIRQGLEARTSRAATLNRRLEARIAQLKATAGDAGPEQRRAIEHDLAILDAQLNARRAWESASNAPNRP